MVEARTGPRVRLVLYGPNVKGSVLAPRADQAQGVPDDEPLRVLIADDDPLARRVVKEVLREAGLMVVAEARTGREAMELALHYEPDIVLMDVVMPELDGIVATRRIVQALPDQLVLMLTGAGDDDDEIALQALHAGAAGYISKEVDIDALPRALAGLHDGEAAISRKMTLRLIERLRRSSEGSAGLRPVKSPLTSREWEVVDLLQAGRTTDEIAGELVLSNETVRSHIKNVTRKLGVHTRAEAVRAANRLRSATREP
jgi:DNA-binding NarL/FixJ family response regulator